MLEPGEIEISYFDGVRVHTLCGKIVDHDDYIEICRRDKNVTVYKKWIVSKTDFKEDPDADS